MFDSYFDDALQYCDRMLGDKLLKSDEEGALEGNGALDEGQARARKKTLARVLRQRGGDAHTPLSHRA